MQNSVASEDGMFIYYNIYLLLMILQTVFYLLLKIHLIKDKGRVLFSKRKIYCPSQFFKGNRHFF